MTERNTGTRYMRLAQILQQQIGSGVYPPDALLPTEQQLCEQFNVSRITVRGAMRELQAQGVIVRKAGIGTRVTAKRPRATFVHVGDSIDDILQFTVGLPFFTIESLPCVVDTALASALELPLGQKFIRVIGLRRHEGAPPVAMSTHYVPALYHSVVAQMHGHRASLADLLATRRGDVVAEVLQAIDATSLRAGEAKLLESRAGSAGLRTRRWYYGEAGDLIIASISLFPQGRYTFTSRIRREPLRAATAHDSA